MPIEWIQARAWLADATFEDKTQSRDRVAGRDRWCYMSRSYKGIKLKKNRVYSGKDLQRTYSVTANTISNWVAAGLEPSDCKRPYLFRGKRVNDFHKARRERLKTQVKPGEFKCSSCQAAVFPDVQTLVENTTINGARMSVGQCSECGYHVRKFVSQDDLDVFEKLRDPNTPVESLREEMRADCGGIGISEKKVGCDWWCANDRILYDWLFYAGHLAEHTIDQHLAAIRFMEDVLQGKPFDNLKIRDVDQVRKALIAALTTKGDAQKSKSTVSHHASQIMAFLEWLIKQDGYKRLPRDLPGYMKMPKAVYAKAMPKNDKVYPSIKEVETLLMGMPSLTNADKRARAMFALAYLGVLRAATVTSLRVCHFDSDNRRIIQDATLSRTKNGKSLRISWFPIPESFVEAVLDWVEVITKAGLRDDDALFPNLRALKAKKDLKDPNRDPIEPMTTTDAVTKAFALACCNADVKYNPHSVKDTLAIERERLQLTGLQRKAWSENMGHEDENTTDTYYGELPEAERFALFEEIKCGANGGKIALDSIRNEEKIAIFDGIAARIMKLTGGNK